MIQMIKYEWKKYIIRKQNLYILLLLTLLFCGVIFFCEGGYVTSKKSYQTFYGQLAPRYGEDTRELLEEEAEELFNKIYTQGEDGTLALNKKEASKKGKYGETQIDDYALLNQALDCLTVEENRNQNIKIILNNPGSRMASEYEEENNAFIADREKLNVIAKTAFFGWPACIFLILVFGVSFSMEHEKNTHTLLSITHKGEDALYVSKIMAAVIAVLVVNLYFFILYMAAQALFLGMKLSDLQQPLFLVEGYGLCASGHTLATLLLTQELFALLLSFMVVFLTMVFSKVTGKSVFAIIASLVLFLAGVALELINFGIYQNPFIANTDNWYLLSVASFYKIFAYEKMFNPFALIQISYYMEQPRFLVLGSRQYPLYFIPLIIMIVVFCACTLYLIQSRRKVSRSMEAKDVFI